MKIPVLTPDALVLVQVKRHSVKIHKPYRPAMARCGYPAYWSSTLPIGLMATARKLRYCARCWR